MGIAFRPMTPEEIAARDQALRDQQARLAQDDGRAYWLARAVGYGLHYDDAAALWDRGMVLAEMSEVSDEAVEKAREFFRE